MVNEEISKFKYTCQICEKSFQFSASYQKHRKLYPYKHKFYECCNSVEGLDVNHICKKKNNWKHHKVKIKSIENYRDNEEKPENDNSNNKCEENENLEKSEVQVTDFEAVSKEADKTFDCQNCNKSFDNNCDLSQHIKMGHKKQSKFKCKICSEKFLTESKYKEHISFHGPEDKVICKNCKKVFNTLKLYQIHAKQNPGSHCFFCKLCLRRFPTELMLEQHVCICQNGKPLHCACGKEFTAYDDVITHSKGTKPFYCCSCPHQSTSLTAYIRHLRKHSKQKPYQCNECEMKFAVIDFLNIHKKKYHSNVLEDVTKEIDFIPEGQSSDIIEKKLEIPEKVANGENQPERIQCPDCGKLFKKNRLANHRNTHKTSASLCPECGKLFDTRFKLTQHIITTHNSEPVKCEVCSKTLKTKKILNEHMKTHLKSELGGRVPQAICPKCGLGLAQKGSLARHILLTHEKHKIVPSNKTYTCQECSLVLPNRGKYYSHRRMHRAMVDRFPCEICGREFNKKQNLRRHYYLLHDEKRVLSDPIFKCQICTRCFREKKNLKRHYKVVHKLEDFT